MESINDFLPPEMLIKIFSHYIEAEGPLKFLKNVSPVCKLWRSLCSTSSLWKEVSWKSMSWNYEHLLKLGERGYLTSTRTLDLSPCTFSNSSIMNAEMFLQVIHHCHNVKSLNMSYNDVLTEEVIQAIAQKFTNMKKLDMWSVWCDFDESDPSHCPRMVSSKIFDPILRASGQTLKHLNLRCHFTPDDAVISKIAECCPSLEELYLAHRQFCTDDEVANVPFPIGSLQSGCPKLRVLHFYYCKLGLDNKLKGGFKEMKDFLACGCDLRGFEIFEILKNSTELEHLQLIGCDNLKLNRVFEIPSNKIKVLVIGMVEKSSDHLDKAVKKWRLTLKKHAVNPLGVDVRSMIKAFQKDNPSPVIEDIVLTRRIALQYLESLLRFCRNLKFLLFKIIKLNKHLRVYHNGEEVLK